MPRIVCWNVNGLRAALKKGFGDHLARLEADVVLLQEVRALPEQLPEPWRDPEGWHVRWHPAEKKGYAGVATWSREPLEVVGTGIAGDGDDPEGRVLDVRTAGLRLVNIYLPSGSSGTDKQAKKEAFMERLAPWAWELATADEPVLLGGDLNIAHTEDDIHNPKSNTKNSGFLPHERHWFGGLLATGWIDVQRRVSGPGKGPYSWWSNRGRARELNRGWRIDYLLANLAAAPRVTGARVDRQGGLTISDHAPMVVEVE